jgi:hypothetical protein
MSTELVAALRPTDLQRETDFGNDWSTALVLTPGESEQTGAAGDIRGVGLNKYKTATNLVKLGYTSLFRIPANLTMGTGLTFKVYLTDDGKNSLDLGAKCYVGITTKRMAADATVNVDSGGGTETLASVTLSSTSGGIAIGSIAIVTANLGTSVVVGDLLLVRIRRKGTDATNDTAPGRVILLGIEVQNT